MQAPTRQPRPAGASEPSVVRPAAPGGTRAAHAASVWAFAFAALSLYWAAGGTVGLHTLGGTIDGLARGGWFTVAVWAAAAVKCAGGLLALALVRPWGTHVPRPLLLAGSWGAGTVLAAYGAANLAARALQAGGLLPTPASMHSAAAWWHLLLWDPWFLAGGVLFLLAAWQYTRAARPAAPRATP